MCSSANVHPLQVAGFAKFEAIVRFVRVLRVYRIFRLGKRISNEVHNRLLVLIFTLFAIIITGAGLFFELETGYGVRGVTCRAPCHQHNHCHLVASYLGSTPACMQKTVFLPAHCSTSQPHGSFVIACSMY